MPTRVPVALASMVCLVACNFSQAGLDPTPATLNFPIAVELYQPDPTVPAPYLFVANSNFDLRFNSGSLIAIDIEALDRVIETCPSPDECTLDSLTFLADNTPGRQPILLDEVGIRTGADGMALRPGDQGRLYLPVRGEMDLTTVDFTPGSGFACEQEFRDEVSTDVPWEAEDIRRCADARRITRRGDVASERALELNGDPVAVAVVPSSEISDVDVGDFVLVVLRDGRVALLRDDGTQATPELIHVLDGFPNNLITVNMQPGTGIGWLATSSTDDVARVGIVVDRGMPNRSFLYDAGARRLGGVDDGEDTRDVLFHPTRTNTAYILARRPESVVEVDLDRTGLTAIDLGLTNIYEVGAGPSRLAMYRPGASGEERTFVVASCFDAQRLFVIDADRNALVSVIGGFSGPFEMAIDPVAKRLYLVDFSISVIRVIDLSPLESGGTPETIATIGDPTPVMSLTGN